MDKSIFTILNVEAVLPGQKMADLVDKRLRAVFFRLCGFCALVYPTICVVKVKVADVDVWERCHHHTPDAGVLETADFHPVWVTGCVCVYVCLSVFDSQAPAHTRVLIKEHS